MDRIHIKRPGDADCGYLSCGRRADRNHLLVQIAEPRGGAECRIPLSPGDALRMAAQLIDAGQADPAQGNHARSASDGSIGSWAITGFGGEVTIVLHDPHRTANETATLAVPAAQAVLLGHYISLHVMDLLKAASPAAD